MFQLTIDAACAYVRKAMDELTSVEEIGMLVSPDALDLRKLVKGSIIEAVVKTHNQAPAYMLDGVLAEHGKDYSYTLSDDGVVEISFLKKVARFISLQVSDSEVVVTSLIPEDSAEGRKQLNRYVRGVPDDPRLVLAKVWPGEHLPKMKYYTSYESESDLAVTMEYFPYPIIKGGSESVTPEGGIPEVDMMAIDEPSINPGVTEEHVEICPRMEYVVLNELTAMILESLNENERAALSREKAVAYIH